MAVDSQAGVDVLERLDSLDGLAESWPVRQEDAASPTESFAWVRESARAFAAQERLKVIVVGRDGGPRGIAPLWVPESGGLELLGARELREPSEFAYSDENVLDALADATARSGRPLSIARIAADSPTVGALRRAYARRGVVLTRAAGATPVVDLDGSDPEQRLNSRRRSDLRRARRRAEDLGSVRFDFHSPSTAELAPLLDDFLAVEAAGWKRRSGTALAYDPMRLAFFRGYASAAAEEGRLRLAFLRIDDRPVAAQYAIELGKRLWLLKIGYDEDFARSSPGQLLMLETLRDSMSRGLTAVEFLGYADEWTRVWTTEERACVSLRAYPFAPGSLRAVATEVSTLARRRLVTPLVRRAGGHYLAGPSVQDALAVARSLAEGGRATTLGYWDGPDDGPKAVADAALAAVEGLASENLDGYVSVKATAFGFAEDLLREVAAQASPASLRLHFDSMGPEAADQTFSLIEGLEGSAELGCTLPGRWVRSLADADWAAARGLSIRVVKGEWADPGAPDRDLRRGFLEVVDRLAGRAAHVAVATHDEHLATEALARLRAAGTSCELELLYRRRGLSLEGVPTRMYVPFGHPWVPYPISQAPWRPKIALQFLRDVLSAGRSDATVP